MIYVFNLYQKIKALFCSVRQVQPLVDNICHFTSEGQLPLFATDIISSLFQMSLEESMARRYEYFWGFALLYFEVMVWLDCRTVLSSVLCLCSRRLKRRERETSWLAQKVRDKSFESMAVTLSSIKQFSTATSVQFITLLFVFNPAVQKKGEHTIWKGMSPSWSTSQQMADRWCACFVWTDKCEWIFFLISAQKANYDRSEVTSPGSSIDFLNCLEPAVLAAPLPWVISFFSYADIFCCWCFSVRLISYF